MPVTVFALDDLLVAPVGRRAAILADVLAHFGVTWWTLPTAATFWRDATGRSFDESAAHALRGTSAAARDPTLPTLVALESTRRARHAVDAGVSLHPPALAELHAQLRGGGRVIVRADSDRRAAERVLELAGVRDLVATLSASDDPPATGAAPGTAREDFEALPGATSLARAWDAIGRRCASWHVAPDDVRIIEADLVLGAVGRQHLARTTVR